MDEPRYVNEGDEFDDEDTAWRYPTDLAHQEMIQEVFRVCGNRKYFKSPKESRQWHLIDSQMSKGILHEKWIEFCIKWAREKNSSFCAIKVEQLGSLILNKARMQDWLAENRDKVRKPEDYL